MDWKPAAEATFDNDPNADKKKFLELITEHIKLYQHGKIPQAHHSPTPEQYLSRKSVNGSAASMIVESGYKFYTSPTAEETDAKVGARIQNGAFRLRNLPYVTTEYFQEIKGKSLSPKPIEGLGNTKDAETVGYPLVGPFLDVSMRNLTSWQNERIRYNDFKAFQELRNNDIQWRDRFTDRYNKISAIPITCDDGTARQTGAGGTSPGCWLQFQAARGIETFTLDTNFYGSFGSLIFKGGFAGDATTPVLSTAYVAGDSGTPSPPVIEAGLNTRTSVEGGATAGWKYQKVKPFLNRVMLEWTGFHQKISFML